MNEKHPLDILHTVFGFKSFRGNQEAVINHLISGGDSLVLMPTGGGKSLCYQLPALIRTGVAIVVSPLISLMQNQVEALRQLGVATAFLNSSLTYEESGKVIRQVRGGNIKLLYVAPERLMSQFFLQLLENIPVSLFAIDEAHCVVHWGHDFRPEYIQLSILHERFPQVPRIALTATADEQTRKEIAKRLNLEQAKIFLTGFDRPNIQYQIHIKNNPRHQLLRFLQEEHPNDSGIVYCLSRKKVDATAIWLQEKGFPALPYHAGMDNHLRAKHQKRFLEEERILIVATIAFGLGIDKPDTRFVAHMDLPKSLESYYQETGRAGRDGMPADAWMVYSMEDVITMRNILASSKAEERYKRIEQQRLNALLGFCETINCRREVLLRYFGDEYQAPCDNCDNCIKPVQTWDGLVAAQKALSCVYRTGQRFGSGHLTDILRGILTPRITKLNHDKVTTFGVGSELNAKGWGAVFRQLVVSGYLNIDPEGYGTLQLTTKSKAILKGEEKIFFREEPKGEIKQKLPKAERNRPLIQPENQALWEKLRQLRLDFAKKQQIPPYMIFHDTTLAEMLRQNPQDLQEMGEITGVGKHKLEKYGNEFLKILQKQR